MNFLKKIIPANVRAFIKKSWFYLMVFKFGLVKWLFLRGEKKYAYFQKRMFDYGARQSRFEANKKVKDLVVGSYEAQDEWKDYDTYLMKYVDVSYKNKVAIDFGTGPGRNIIRFSKLFKRLDGVDISSVNIDNAKINLRNNGIPIPNLYVNNGEDLATVPSDTYDYVFSTIAMQHICVYNTRFKIFQEYYRIMKPGARMSHQMGYGTDAPNSVDYYANDYAALKTNGHRDTQIKSPDLLKKDLEKIGFKNFEFWIRPAGPGGRQKEWIYFTATK